MIEIIFKNLLWAAAAYVLVVACMYMFQRSLMYFPDTNKPALVEDVSEITVTTQDGLEITGWYIESRKGKPVILYFHGNAQDHAVRLPRVQPYIEEGYNVLLAGYRGYAGNPGNPTEEGLYADARAYLAALKEKGFQDKDTILYGESLGTGVAVQMAFENPDMRALVLEAPYTSTVDVGAWRFFWAPVRLLMKDRFDSLSKIKDITMPLIIKHGHRDQVIPFRFGKELYEAANEPKIFLEFEGADHNNLMANGGAEGILAHLP